MYVPEHTFCRLSRLSIPLAGSGDLVLATTRRPICDGFGTTKVTIRPSLTVDGWLLFLLEVFPRYWKILDLVGPCNPNRKQDNWTSMGGQRFAERVARGGEDGLLSGCLSPHC